MFQQLSLAIAKHMVSDQIIHQTQLPVYQYGLELVLSSITGILALVIVSFLGGEPFWWLPYLVGFVPIRLMGGGYHAKSHLSCISLFTLFYAINLIIFKHFIFTKAIWALICVVNVLVLFAFCPVEPNNKPLPAAQRKLNRSRSLFLGMFNFSIAAIFFFLQINVPIWVTLYFAGSSMAAMSIMLAVLINSFGKE